MFIELFEGTYKVDSIGFFLTAFIGHLKPAYKKVCGMCLFQHFENYARGSLKGKLTGKI